MDVKVSITVEEDTLQHQLLVSGMMIDMMHRIKDKSSHPKLWDLRDSQTCRRFQLVSKHMCTL